MSPTTLVTLDEYLTTAYAPDREYLDGELIERNMGEFDHSALQGIIFALLYAQRMQAGIYLFPELRVQVAPRRYRVPDITVMTRKGKGKVLHEPPFLCVEILSPEDRASRVQLRIDDFLSFGVPNVWVIDPASKKGWSYSPEGRHEARTLLTTSAPDLTLSLDDVFSALADTLD